MEEFPRYIRDMSAKELAELMRRSRGRIIETTIPQGYLAIKSPRHEWAEAELHNIREGRASLTQGAE